MFSSCPQASVFCAKASAIYSCKKLTQGLDLLQELEHVNVRDHQAQQHRERHDQQVGGHLGPAHLGVVQLEVEK